MPTGTLVLLSGPTDDPAWWAPVAAALDRETPVVAPARGPDPGTPFGTAWIAANARELHARRLAGPLLLVGHGLAGPLLPALARTQRAAGRRVGGYVFVDATLPRPGATTHLDLLRAADAAAAEAAHDTLHEAEATWPPGAAHPRGHDFWTEPLPPVTDWPDAPCTYVRTGAEPPECGDTAFWARSAKARAWQVVENPDLAPVFHELAASLPG